ncbi:MAG: hypothetical protein JWP89_3811 [Schlesneria sp.]|nr:hypothetical protein [Schlesneria sp.]
MRLCFRLAVLFAILPATMPAWADDTPVRHRVLLLGQKPDSHPATTHEYMAGVRLLGLLLERSSGIQTVVAQADSPWEAGPEMLDGADAAIVFLSEGAKWVTEDANRLAAFQRLAKRGGGLTCLHWGMGTRESKPIAEFTSLFGACHGGPDRKYKFATLAVKPMETHPVTAGITPFEVRDEFYYALKQPAPTPHCSKLRSTGLTRRSRGPANGQIAAARLASADFTTTKTGSCRSIAGWSCRESSGH